MTTVTSPKAKALAKYLVPNLGTIILLALFVWVQSAGAFSFMAPSGPTNVRISYQGRLTGVDGLPLTGTYPITLALYTVPTSGAPFWSETQATVTVQDGLFDVLLGSVVALPNSMPDGNLYLGMTVGSEEITPRQLLSSSYHALESNLAASVADGAVSTAQLADNAVTSAKLANETVGSVHVVDNSLAAADLASDSVTVSELAGDAVNSSKIVDDSIAAVDLASDSVGEGEIASGAVGVGELADNAVSSAKIQDGQVSSADIADNTIAEADIADTFKARDADLLDGQDSGYFSVAGHAHDERYFTEGESDGRFVNASGDTMSGNLNMGGNNVNNANSVQIGDQGTISAKVGRDGRGPNMVFETDDQFTFQQNDGFFTIAPTAPGTTLATSGWLYMATTIVPTLDSYFYLGGANTRRWHSIYVRNVYSGDISEDVDLNYKPETGDVVVWRDGQLLKSTEANDRRVFGVAKVTSDRPFGTPVTLGMFVIKVTGKVREGDFLVTSDTPGYAMAVQNTTIGTVIATALEDFDGQTGLIKAMIRKF